MVNYKAITLGAIFFGIILLAIYVHTTAPKIDTHFKTWDELGLTGKNVKLFPGK